MKKTITVNYCTKRTFNLGDYENIAPIHTITEEIELNEGEDFTPEQYHESFLKLKKICRAEMIEDGTRIKGRDFSYLSEYQMSQILSLCKGKKLNVDEEVKKMGFMSISSLTEPAASNLIKLLTIKPCQENYNHQEGNT